MRYEWNEAKRLTNLAKHGLDFRDVVYVFNDPNAQLFADTNSITEKKDTFS